MKQRILSRLDQITEAERTQARWLLLDLIGTLVAGTQTPLHHSLRASAPKIWGGDQISMTGVSGLSHAGVALVDGMTLDAVDAHDGYRPAKGHVGCGLLPGLLALGPDQDFLDKLIIGYELGSRLGAALHASAADYHTSGAWIAPTIAAVGGLDLDEEIWHHAIGIAEYHGPRSPMMHGIAHPTMLKDGSGWGAMTGVAAVEMAKSGFTGAPAGTLEAALGDLNERWLIHDQYLKPYACCRWAHPAIDAVLDAKARAGFVPERIRVHTFNAGVALSQTWPANTEQAQYSSRFAMAQALQHGAVLYPQVSDQALNDPIARDWFDRIEMIEDLPIRPTSQLNGGRGPNLSVQLAKTGRDRRLKRWGTPKSR